MRRSAGLKPHKRCGTRRHILTPHHLPEHIGIGKWKHLRRRRGRNHQRLRAEPKAIGSVGTEIRCIAGLCICAGANFTKNSPVPTGMETLNKNTLQGQPIEQRGGDNQPQQLEPMFRMQRLHAFKHQNAAASSSGR